MKYILKKKKKKGKGKNDSGRICAMEEPLHGEMSDITCILMAFQWDPIEKALRSLFFHGSDTEGEQGKRRTKIIIKKDGGREREREREEKKSEKGGANPFYLCL